MPLQVRNEMDSNHTTEQDSLSSQVEQRNEVFSVKNVQNCSHRETEASGKMLTEALSTESMTENDIRSTLIFTNDLKYLDFAALTF